MRGCGGGRGILAFGRIAEGFLVQADEARQQVGARVVAQIEQAEGGHEGRPVLRSMILFGGDVPGLAAAVAVHAALRQDLGDVGDHGRVAAQHDV